jgi:hypothetical protein
MSGDPARPGPFSACLMTTGSMKPAISPGETLLVESPPLERLRPGDILLLDRGEELKVVHRFLREETRDGALHVVTKGDASAVWDAPLPASRVLGRVVAIARAHHRWLRIDGRRGRSANAAAAAGYRAAALLCPPERGLDGFVRAAASMRWTEELLVRASRRAGWRSARPLRRLILRLILRRLAPSPAAALNAAIAALWRPLAGA